jgi:hypothetical protein
MGLTLGGLLLGAVSGLSRLILFDRCTSEWVREFVVQMCKLSCFLGRYRRMCRNAVELCDDDNEFRELTLHRSNLYTTQLREYRQSYIIPSE